VEITVFRIIQEALTNIARHASVQEAQVNITIDKNITIEVIDQGTGFDIIDDEGESGQSGGLSGMQERARLLGGKFQIYSKKGAGTRVVAEIPLMEGTR
jgi:signal transduction histidine kinase